ncbi:hypothetical protein H5410_046343 [Solanum commersonii]|uniref:Uncharacterized protein n=1 Tax=Solanum commersonii TaxID=4109 RepID=A0A9J5XE28_SOLCO|nr:hypothetical protein H5410_046343 [Solanum commersonii]
MPMTPSPIPESFGAARWKEECNFSVQKYERFFQDTWARGGIQDSTSRIVRFLYNPNGRSSEISSDKQIILPKVISDHWPLSLKYGNRDNSKSYFKF